jgi:hypothetical protein
VKLRLRGREHAQPVAGQAGRDRDKERLAQG